MLAKNGQGETAEPIETVKPSEVLRPVNGQQLKAILTKREEAAGTRGDIGKDLRAFIAGKLGDKVYLDRAMLPVVEKLFRMEDDAKVAYHLDNLLHMLDVSGINARAEKVARLPLADRKRSADPKSAEA